MKCLICVFWKSVHICSDRYVYNTYISGMYNFKFPWTWKSKSKILLRSEFEPTVMSIAESCLIHCSIRVFVRGAIVTVYDYYFTWSLVTFLQDQQPSPAQAIMMTLPAQASTWTSLKQRSAAKQGYQFLNDILHLGYFCQSINQLDVIICHVKCH